MPPSFSIATDNIYKFTCLFGLALIISAIFSVVSMYSASLERKVKYMEALILLEAKTEKNKIDEDLLEMNKKLLEVAKSNDKTGNIFAGAVLGTGIALSIFGAFLWHGKIQLRDDKLAQLQIEKLELELSKLRGELFQASSTEPVATVSQQEGTNDGSAVI
ncbi:hypothetical protein [Azospira sp. I13]|uniref:hypothetical protein n=1 Tax=Azospira sp. I13 TaxID=1765050 RepID=UPI001057B505|nr:hypothetical protein [Azospira sp. I13]